MPSQCLLISSGLDRAREHCCMLYRLVLVVFPRDSPEAPAVDLNTNPPVNGGAQLLQATWIAGVVQPGQTVDALHDDLQHVADLPQHAARLHYAHHCRGRRGTKGAREWDSKPMPHSQIINITFYPWKQYNGDVFHLKCAWKAYLYGHTRPSSDEQLLHFTAFCYCNLVFNVAIRQLTWCSLWTRLMKLLWKGYPGCRYYKGH